MDEISKSVLRAVSLFILGLALVLTGREAAAQAPKPDEVHVFHQAKAADFPTVHKLPSNKRHLLLPGTAPAALAIGKDLKVILFRYPHFISGPKGYRGKSQPKDPKFVCGTGLYFSYVPSWESNWKDFHLVLGPGTHTDLASEDYFVNGSGHRYASMIVFRSGQDLPDGVLLRNLMQQDPLAYEVFLPLAELYFQPSVVYQDPRLSVFGRGLNVEGWPKGASWKVTLHPNPQPGTSKPILVTASPKKSWINYPDDNPVDLAAKGFHGLWKVEILNPNIAVLAEGAIKTYYDHVTPRRLDLDLSGKWDSDLGEARFEQEGDRVNGLLIYREPAVPRRSATLDGTLREGRLEFTWYFAEDEHGRGTPQGPEVREPAEPRRRDPQGRGVLEATDDGRLLSGWYTDRDIDGGETRQPLSLRR